ncbi:MAG: DUF2946 family protein [Piscinibacter sp.]
MTRRSPTRRWTAWIAALALLFAAIAPALAHALPARDDWVEVCTAQGSKWVRAADVDTSAAVSNDAATLAHEHCVTCSSHQLPALPLPEFDGQARRSPSEAAPVAVAFAPPRLHDGGFAQPRAPPARS